MLIVNLPVQCNKRRKSWIEMEELGWPYIAQSRHSSTPIFGKEVNLDVEQKQAIHCPYCGDAFSLSIEPKKLIERERSFSKRELIHVRLRSLLLLVVLLITGLLITFVSLKGFSREATDQFLWLNIAWLALLLPMMRSFKRVRKPQLTKPPKWRKFSMDTSTTDHEIVQKEWIIKDASLDEEVKRQVMTRVTIDTVWMNCKKFPKAD